MTNTNIIKTEASLRRARGPRLGDGGLAGYSIEQNSIV